MRRLILLMQAKKCADFAPDRYPEDTPLRRFYTRHIPAENQPGCTRVFELMKRRQQGAVGTADLQVLRGTALNPAPMATGTANRQAPATNPQESLRISQTSQNRRNKQYNMSAKHECNIHRLCSYNRKGSIYHTAFSITKHHLHNSSYSKMYSFMPCIYYYIYRYVFFLPSYNTA